MNLKKKLAVQLLKHVPLNELSDYVGHEKMRHGLDKVFNDMNKYLLDTYFREGDGFKVLTAQPQVMNILTTVVENMCQQLDGTLVSRKGHNGDCQWKTDGQIWWHL